MSLLPSLHSRELLLYAYRSDGTASRSSFGGVSPLFEDHLTHTPAGVSRKQHQTLS